MNARAPCARTHTQWFECRPLRPFWESVCLEVMLRGRWGEDSQGGRTRVEVVRNPRARGGIAALLLRVILWRPLMLMRCVTTYECTVFDDMPIGVEIRDTKLGQQTRQMSVVHYSIKYGIEVRHGYHGLTGTPLMNR